MHGLSIIPTFSHSKSEGPLSVKESKDARTRNRQRRYVPHEVTTPTVDFVADDVKKESIGAYEQNLTWKEYPSLSWIG